MNQRPLAASVAIGFVAAVAYSLVLLIFTVIMLPSSGPPSEGAAFNASFFFWLVGATAVWLVVASSPRTPRSGLFITVVATVSLLALAGWVGPRFERARLDSCFWGTGGFDQQWCDPPRDSLPGVTQAWLGAALVTALLLGAIVWIRRRVPLTPAMSPRPT